MPRDQLQQPDQQFQWYKWSNWKTNLSWINYDLRNNENHECHLEKAQHNSEGEEEEIG